MVYTTQKNDVMPSRVIEETANDPRRFLLNEYNTRYQFKFQEKQFHTEGLPPNVSTQVQWSHLLLSAIMFVMFIVLVIFWSTKDIPAVSLWNSAMVFEEVGMNGYVSRSMVLLQHLFGEHFCPGHDVATTPMYRLNAFPLALHTNDKINLWVLLLFVIVVTGTLELFRSNALPFKWPVPDGPDLSRWLEYAITSPLQVLVVAIAFHIREVAQLATIGTLQAVLVIIGFSVEREIQMIKNGFVGSMLPLVVLFMVSLAGHIVIWVTIRQRSLLENEMALDCTYKNSADRAFFSDMKGILDGIYWSEALLFSCFIFVPPYTFYIIATDDVWIRTARIYSILSVAAKSALIIGFVFYAISFSGTNPVDRQLNVTWFAEKEPIQLLLNATHDVRPTTTPVPT